MPHFYSTPKGLLCSLAPMNPRNSPDLGNVLDTLQMGVLRFDEALRLDWLTSRASALLGVGSEVVGKPIASIGQRIGYRALAHDAERARAGDPIARDILIQGKRRHVILYAQQGDGAGGILVSFSDGDERAFVLAAQRERLRIARVLHGDLQQLIHAALIRLDVVLDDGGAVETFGPPMRTLLREATALTRSLAVSLSPPASDSSALDALHWLVEHVGSRFGLRVRVEEVGRERELPEDVQWLLFEISRELIFNVVKHAEAEEARVTLAFTPDTVQLTVEDEGRRGTVRGSPTESAGVGFGLGNIRDWLHAMDGRIEFNSGPELGTRVVVILPTP